MWKKQNRQKIEQGISGSIADLAQRYHLGQPLTLYPQSVFWLRVCFDVPRISLLVGLGIFFLRVSLVLWAFFQLRMLSSQPLVGSSPLFQHEDQIFQLQNSVIEGLVGIFTTLLGLGGLGLLMRRIAHVIPRYWVVCRDGVLCVCPKKVEVTRWNEVTGLSRAFIKTYTVYRSGKESLSFGYSLERFEELAEQVRQHIGEHGRNQEGEEASER